MLVIDAGETGQKSIKDLLEEHAAGAASPRRASPVALDAEADEDDEIEVRAKYERTSKKLIIKLSLDAKNIDIFITRCECE